MREHPKRKTKLKYLRVYQHRYYAKLRKAGYKIFTIKTPASTVLELKLFNRQLCLAFEAEKKKQEEQKENADAQTTQG